MAQQVFKRIEKKYMLTRPQREALLQALEFMAKHYQNN